MQCSSGNVGRLIVISLLCLARPLVGAAADGQAGAGGASAPLTIDAAVREAIDHNLDLLAQRFNVDAADAAVVTASLRPNPVITANVMRPDRSLVDTGISPYEEVFRTDYVFERGSKRERRIEAARLARSVAELDLLNATRTLVLDVESAFVDVQVAKLSLQLAQENLSAFNGIVTVNIERVRTGDLASVELSRSQLAALQFTNDVAHQQLQLIVAKNHLSTLLGRGPVGDTIDVAGDLRNDPQSVDLATVRQQALVARPDLRSVRGDQAHSVADLRLQLANGKIDYTISGEYHRQQGTTISGNSYGVFLSMPLPIFNRNQGEIARAQVQQQQADARVRAVEAQVSSEVTSAYAQYASSRDVLQRIEQVMLRQARDVRAATEYSYRRGEASLVEFLDAVRAFNDTMQSYNEARADYARSLYALDSASGRGMP